MTVPDRVALVQGDTRITYEEMATRVKRLANALQGLGVTAGSHVAVLAMNSPQVVETYYACATLGAVFVPLNYRAKQEELTYMINTAGAEVIFVGERYLDLLESIKPSLTTIKHIIAYDAWPSGALNYDNLLATNPDDDIFVEVDDEAPTILMFTSGTTAMPKGVLLSYLDFTAYVINTVEPANPADENVNINLVSVPFSHIAGATVMMSAIWGGRTIVILPQFDPESWMAAVQNERVTHSFVVPTMLKRVMEHPKFNDYDISSLQLIVYGAAPMPYEVVRKAVEVFHCGLMNGYGQTEATSTLTYLGPEDHDIKGLSADQLELKLKRLRSVGRPMDDVAIMIMDDQFNVLPAHQEGEICVASARVMSGYYGNEEATKEAIHDGVLHTGDLGYLDDDNYLFITGRKKDLIIRGGENISAGEIEAVLEDHTDIEEAAVIGVPDIEWGEVVKAVVVPRKGATIVADDVIAYTKQHLASYKAPSYIAVVDELPRNPMGKVLKTDLRKIHGGPDNN